VQAKKMRKFLLIALILSLIFVILNYVYLISFVSDELNYWVFLVFILLFLIHLTFPFRKVGMKILVTVIPLFIIGSGVYLWEIFGYESRIDRTWNFKNHSIQLEHRLQITGPGTFWFVVNEKIGQNFMEKKKYERRADFDKMERNKPFEFTVGNDTLSITCCENKIIRTIGSD